MSEMSADSTLARERGRARGRDNVERFGLDMHPVVFPVAAISIVAVAVLALVFQIEAAAVLEALKRWLVVNLDWFFASSMNFFLLLCVFLACSRYGRIRIGGPDARPDYGYLAWIAMVVSAGIGIGLMYFGVLEPMTHTLQPPLGIAAGSPEAARVGMAAMAYHWGLQGWAIYAVVGLSLAHACFSRGLPLSLRSAFHPLVGDRIWGWFGHVVDVSAVFATMFGLATSLGYGAEQLAAGLNHLYGVEPSDGLRVALIGGITGVALGSVVAGMSAGVKRLSTINVTLAGLLLAFVFVAGPTVELIAGLVRLLGDYAVYMPAFSAPFGRADTAFFHEWTIVYWVWWMAWAPFVGMFIARISKGRTVREFMVSLLVAPTVLCMVWMTVFGGTALHQMAAGHGGVREMIANDTPELSLFMLLDQLPGASITAGLAVVLIILFFVTSSDSGSIVIDTVTAGGKLHTPILQRIFWCGLEGAVAIVLLVGGGLQALRSATVCMGFPFGIVVLLMSYSLYRGLREDAAAAHSSAS